MKYHERKEEKRKEAKERSEYYSELTLQQKIYKLDTKFGVGLGAIKERIKLSQLFDSVESE